MLSNEQKTRFFELEDKRNSLQISSEERAELRLLEKHLENRYYDLTRRGVEYNDEQRAELVDIRAFYAERNQRHAAKTPVSYDPNANYDGGDLDYVGLNVKGQPVESAPEMKPLTDEQKEVLDAIAESGASVQALAELEQQMRTSETLSDEAKREGRNQQFAWRVESANKYASTLPRRRPESTLEARRSLEQYIERCEKEVTNCENLAAVVPSTLLKLAPAIGMKAFAIVDRESHNATITKQQIGELKALLGEL